MYFLCSHPHLILISPSILPRCRRTPTPPAKMVALSLKICVRQCNLVKTMQFEPSTAVYDACRIIRERVPEAQTGQGTVTRQTYKRLRPRSNSFTDHPSLTGERKGATWLSSVQSCLSTDYFKEGRMHFGRIRMVPASTLETRA